MYRKWRTFSFFKKKKRFQKHFYTKIKLLSYNIKGLLRKNDGFLQESPFFCGKKLGCLILTLCLKTSKFLQKLFCTKINTIAKGLIWNYFILCKSCSGRAAGKNRRIASSHPTMSRLYERGESLWKRKKI